MKLSCHHHPSSVFVGSVVGGVVVSGGAAGVSIEISACVVIPVGMTLQDGPNVFEWVVFVVTLVFMNSTDLSWRVADAVVFSAVGCGILEVDVLRCQRRLDPDSAEA